MRRVKEGEGRQERTAREQRTHGLCGLRRATGGGNGEAAEERRGEGGQGTSEEEEERRNRKGALLLLVEVLHPGLLRVRLP